MAKPFEIALDYGAEDAITFPLDEAQIRGAGIKVQYAIADDEGDPDERTRLWHGVLAIARHFCNLNDTDPIEIFDGARTYLIPPRALRCVTVFDPESPDRAERRIGFGLPAGGEDAS